MIYERLPTQDRVLKWHSDKSMKCALCEEINDSHEHLFFHCKYSSKVWGNAKRASRIVCMDDDWEMILDELIGLPNRKNIWIIVKKIVYAAVVYFLWQERNLRLFQNVKRKWDVLWKVIEENVKLKLSSLKVVKSHDVETVFNIWGIEYVKE